MIPRNLRKPTLRRVSCWWADYTWAWHMVGVAYYQTTAGDE